MSRNGILGAISAAIVMLLAIASAILAFSATTAVAATTSVAPDIYIRPGIFTSSVRAPEAVPRYYIIRPGDSLSKIAQTEYHSMSDWPVLYWANRKTIHWANIIYTGRVLSIPVLPRHIPAPPESMSPPPPPAPSAVFSASYVVRQAPYHRHATVRVIPSASVIIRHRHPTFSSSSYGHVNPSGYSGFQSCVISRESGGNSQVMNSSGHYGLYQFSASTWAAYGGSPAVFGHASVSQQNAVFSNAMARGGQSNWAPYDGC